MIRELMKEGSRLGTMLVMLPDNESKLQGHWQGPYEVCLQVGPVNYEVFQPGKKRLKWIYHAVEGTRGPLDGILPR